MRDVGLTRAEAEKQQDLLWDEIKRYGGLMSERAAKLDHGGRNKAYDDEWKRLERLRLDCIGKVRKIEESGVIPWLEDDGLGSFDPELEVWARRSKKLNYHVDHKGEYDPVLVISSQTRQYAHNLQLTREMAEELRDQLVYELERWEEA